MKNVVIKYTRNGSEKIAEGNTNDLAIREIVGDNGSPIHTAKGRLSQSALLKRASKTGILIQSITVKGNPVYVSESIPESAAIPSKPNGGETPPKAAADQSNTGLKFMQSRYAGKCKETGKRIAKGDLILYQRLTKSVYSVDSSKFQQNKDNTTIFGQSLVNNVPSNEGSQEAQAEAFPVQTPEVDVEAIKAAAEAQTPLSDVVVTQPVAADPIAAMAAMFKPYLQQAEINQDQINEMIRKALTMHNKVITVKREELPPVEIGTQHHSFEDLLLFCANRINVQLVGAAGSGKTHAASEVAKALGLNYYAISVGAMTTKTDFQGYMNARGEYVLTQFRQAFEHGGIFLLDEMDAGNANVITTINMALSNGQASYPDGMIDKHDDFVLIAAANTYGLGADRMYVGRNQLDAASIDRFAVLDWDYDESIEIKIACNDRWTRYVQKCRANMDRLKLRYVISPRASVNGGIMLKAGMAVDKVKKTILFKAMTDAHIKSVTEGVTY